MCQRIERAWHGAWVERGELKGRARLPAHRLLGWAAKELTLGRRVVELELGSLGGCRPGPAKGTDGEEDGRPTAKVARLRQATTLES